MAKRVGCYGDLVSVPSVAAKPRLRRGLRSPLRCRLEYDQIRQLTCVDQGPTTPAMRVDAAGLTQRETFIDANNAAVFAFALRTRAPIERGIPNAIQLGACRNQPDQPRAARVVRLGALGYGYAPETASR